MIQPVRDHLLAPPNLVAMMLSTGPVLCHCDSRTAQEEEEEASHYLRTRGKAWYKDVKLHKAHSILGTLCSHSFIHSIKSLHIISSLICWLLPTTTICLCLSLSYLGFIAMVRYFTLPNSAKTMNYKHIYIFLNCTRFVLAVEILSFTEKTIFSSLNFWMAVTRIPSR